MGMKPTERLIEYGQSLWYDNISRTMLDNGELARLIEEYGVRGMTSNPTIFDNAISKSTVYDSTISRMVGQSSSAIFEELAVEDIGRAADMLLPVYRSSGGDDGFVSIEVSPLLASDTEGTIKEGKHLFERLNRPNIMIKVPGTEQGIPAVRALLEEGVHVNITLLFGVENYVRVAQTYCDALRARAAKGLPVSSIRSVASFFVSRVDSAIDKQLEGIATSDPGKSERARALLGKFGIANSRVAYYRFREIFEGDSFKDLQHAGAVPQRPLWASTGVKNPAYRDVMYIEELIGPQTVNTVPHDTLMAFADHGEVRATVENDIETALTMEGQLRDLGVDVGGIIRELQIDGVKKFVESFVALDSTIKSKVESKSGASYG